MFRHSAWAPAVGSYSSGSPAARTKSTRGFHRGEWSPCNQAALFQVRDEVSLRHYPYPVALEPNAPESVINNLVRLALYGNNHKDGLEVA